jgi:transcription elongation factor Elf1
VNEEFPIKEADKKRIIKDFKSNRFACIRCGSRKIKITTVEPYNDRINVNGRYKASNSEIEIESKFNVTSLLFCEKCKHRFYMKILDQGIRNTDTYFDNTLE